MKCQGPGCESEARDRLQEFCGDACRVAFAGAMNVNVRTCDQLGCHTALISTDKQCRTCRFWLDRVTHKDDPRTVRADGKQYFIGSETETTPSFMRGFGGKKWTATFLDGRVVEIASLWHQGDIPERFRDRLPDNATLVEA